MRVPPAISHNASVIAELRKNPELASEYLRTAAEEATDEEGRAVLLKAIKQVAEARGMANVAHAAGMKPESLSRALSARGNPRFSTLMAITQALGLTMMVKPSR